MGHLVKQDWYHKLVNDLLARRRGSAALAPRLLLRGSYRLLFSGLFGFCSFDCDKLELPAALRGRLSYPELGIDFQ